MTRRGVTPLLWALFSAGGTLAALLVPAHLFLNGLAFPLGLLEVPGYDGMRRLASHPLARLYVLALVSLPLFHWAHRFRYTLYDGLQLKHLEVLIATICYGTALAATVVAAVAVWRL